MSIYNFIFVIIFVKSLFIANLDGAIFLNDYSLYGPFKADDVRLLRNWQFVHSTVNPDVIRLTDNEPNKRGAVWSALPLLKRDWEFQVQFRIHGESKSGGNGIGIWYVKDPAQIGPIFGSSNFFSGLGIFIDTADFSGMPHRHVHPYISAMVNNGSMSYYHDEDGTFMEIGKCVMGPTRTQPHGTRIAISYVQNTLNIFLSTDNSGKWIPCFTAHGVHLPTGYYFGVSASNGEFTDIHDLFSVTALDMTIPGQAAEERRFIVPHAENYRVSSFASIATPEKTVESEKDVKAESAPVIPPASEDKVFDSKADVTEAEEKEIKEEKQKFVSGEPKPEFEKHGDKIPGETQMDDDASEPWSWTFKLLFLVFAFFAFLYTFQACKKYQVRRSEAMAKRLY